MNTNFDVIVVGGGHAGIEAAHAAAKMGSKTLLLSLDLDKIGLMPCNPSIGGVGKGHMVFEISALGGLMPKLCSQTYLQARMLNTSKGPAVQGLRLQIDKEAYRQLSKKMLLDVPNLTLAKGKVEEILTQNSVITGVKTQDATYSAPCVVLTTGTFLNGLVHVGFVNHAAGRRGEEAVTTLSQILIDLGLKMGRLKTGTPPRLKKDSLDFSKMEMQDQQELNYLYEFYPQKVEQKLPCYITHTNENTHNIIMENMHHSPILTGNIKGKPPRYCPSIEDKIKRFPDKTGHHVFVEPEDASYDEVYPAGVSTSMPLEVQIKFIQSIPGFENAIITKAGYAVEYDFVYPNQLLHTLETKKVSGLFLAGQINGTTGYEEAAGQGIIAGINASLKAAQKLAFIISREESYIGIMIDDLVTLGVEEPYRMFTSRAERRIVLRQDNVFYRLADKAYALGMIESKLYEDIKKEDAQIQEVLTRLRSKKTNGDLIKLFGELECNQEKILELAGVELTERAILSIYAEVKYFDYLKRETLEIEKAQKYRMLIIPKDFDFKNMPGLSKELQEKLLLHAPENIAQAMLIQGMTPAAISLLIFRVRELEKQLSYRKETACQQLR
ncbi:MAG: tRNA uridine-5-carboxymethylaminomethyl(34) synthesis enzyme MnmG [Candidatus Babeliales bacterium]|nr:tRNA uridine-5-carboxymethylaminomethyl(34) synthesis enzyme MnmG [Candidatus Babeliales bacterium]